MSYPYPPRAEIGLSVLAAVEPVAVEPEPEPCPELDALVDALSEVHRRKQEPDLLADFVGACISDSVNGPPPLQGPVEHGACDCCSEMVPLDELSDLIAYGTDTTACDACRGLS